MKPQSYMQGLVSLDGCWLKKSLKVAC